ncbi:MAG: malate dehydrogenase, partial [Alistipes sp.]|nr:malate dehydrogenase [Alistipes sp.]
IGVPVVIGREGIEKIIEIELTDEEKAAFEASAAAVRKVNQILYDTNAI